MKRLLTISLLAAAFCGPAHADYEDGRKLFEKREYVAAGQQFEAAARLGSMQAMSALGGMYAEGLGVERDLTRAFQWFLRAAEAGHVPAQGTVARMYGTGQGVSKNDAKSLEWALKAAEKGDAESQYILGVRHIEGLGVKRDSGRALLWFGAAAEQGMVRAQYSMGFLLTQGAAITKNTVEAQTMQQDAYKWLLIAQRGGEADAAKGLVVLKNRLTPDQIAAAEKSAASFKPIKPYASSDAPQAKP